MRDIFEDLFANEPLDPIEAARRAMRPRLRRRFYQHAVVREGEGELRVLLDAKAARTPARRLLAAPTRALAESIAAEWEAQGEQVDPATMPLTRLANVIIDAVSPAPEPVRAEIAKYLASDLLCYRAATPEGLVARQSEQWDPILRWAAEAFGGRLVPSEGVMFVQQPAGAIDAMVAALPSDPWRLGAVSAMTALTGSGLLALAVARGRLGVAEAWRAAHLDEDWNMEFWGRDELALARRAFRLAEMEAAAAVARLAGG